MERLLRAVSGPSGGESGHATSLECTGPQETWRVRIRLRMNPDTGHDENLEVGAVTYKDCSIDKGEEIGEGERKVTSIDEVVDMKKVWKELNDISLLDLNENLTLNRIQWRKRIHVVDPI
ncbi:hypothetical protein IEQ34_000145 [Dendrobium chrysotoxum]|uniref:Uncharacterized protein n=1 Tax=Dendrobium chrysotoxum TaxID=161865 RepID=A0AAV7HPP1_DENCH|nr:hypothetical protein IEQ34_000145 [Dendrobium chrysotoxum]